MEKMGINGYKSLMERFQFDPRGKFFAVRPVSHWNNLSLEVVDSPVLENFETQRISGQSPGPSCLGCAFAKKGWTRWSLKSSFNSVFYDLTCFRTSIGLGFFCNNLPLQSGCSSGLMVKLCDYSLFYEYCKLCLLW